MALLAAELVWATRWNTMERAEVVQHLRDGCDVTEEQENEVIAYGPASPATLAVYSSSSPLAR